MLTTESLREHVPSGTRQDRFGQWGEGTPLTSAACPQRAPVASESSSRSFLVEGQGKGAGPGKLRAAPRKPRATRHPGLGQNTRSDPNMGGRVREPPTPHGPRHPDSSIMLPQNHRGQVGRRPQRPRRPSLSCSPGHEASTPVPRLPGHLTARQHPQRTESRPPPFILGKDRFPTWGPAEPRPGTAAGAPGERPPAPAQSEQAANSQLGVSRSRPASRTLQVEGGGQRPRAACHRCRGPVLSS